MPSDDEHQAQVRTVVQRLAADIDVPVQDLELEVAACFRQWDAAAVRDYVPIFVERAVRSRHRAARLSSAG